MLLVWLVLAVHTAGSISVTHDEFWHLPAGLRAWSGDFAVDRLNPPLSRLWAALPVRLCGITAGPAEDASDLGGQFIAARDDFFRWYVLGRLFHLMWSVLTAALLYRWCLELYGIFAARLALLCFLCCPNVLAHGALVTPDAAVMFGFLLTSYCLAGWLANPTWKHTLVLGAALGGLQALKFTGVVFGPVMIAAGIWMLIQAKASDGLPVRRSLLCGQLAAMLGVSLLVLAALYGFQGLGRPFGSLTLQSVSFREWQQRLSFCANWPVPLPVDYVLGIDQQRMVMEQPHPIFLDGVWQVTGFLSYYPKTLLYKLSHGFQALVVIGAVLALIRKRKSRKANPTFPLPTSPFAFLISLWLPVLILFGLATFSGMQLGVRYILPVIPPFAMLAGRVAAWVSVQGQAAAWLIRIAAVLLLGSSLRFHPHHLAYFNEYAGGPIGGRQHLLDSNLDWGQDLFRARDFIQAHADENPRFVYFGTVQPSRLGVTVPFPPSRFPEPGLYLVSVNFVMGRPHAAWQPDGTRRALDIHEFGYFRLFEPIGHAGDSIDIYRITEEDIRRAASRRK